MFSGIQYKEKEEWWQVVIADESALSGESLIRLLQLVSQHVSAQFVVLDDIEGAGEGINGLVSDDETLLVLSVQAVIDCARAVVQFDWGDFFLLGHKEEAVQWLPGAPYDDSVRKALVTIRAVDDTYFYIYTRNKDLVDVLVKNYPQAEVWKGPIKGLEFPY